MGGMAAGAMGMQNAVQAQLTEEDEEALQRPAALAEYTACAGMYTHAALQHQPRRAHTWTD